MHPHYALAALKLLHFANSFLSRLANKFVKRQKLTFSVSSSSWWQQVAGKQTVADEPHCGCAG